MGTAAAITKRPLAELIQASKSRFEGRLPAGMTVERFMYGLATACQKNPGLLKCEPQSVILAAYEAAEIGCDLSPSLALGWLIPYGAEAQFQPSYRFFIQRAYDTGCVASFYAEVVYERDTFERYFAPKRSITHKPPKDNERGQPIGAYALVEFKDGHLDWEYMSKEQIERHRNASKMPGSLMWKTFWEEGWRKTPIRILAKRLPLTNPGMEALAEVINKDAERDAEPVIPGALEVEQIAVPTAAPARALQYFVDRELTTIRGDWSILPESELKAMGRRVVDSRTLTIPAANTDQFICLCNAHDVRATEGEFQASDKDLPESMFDKASA